MYRPLGTHLTLGRGWVSPRLGISLQEELPVEGLVCDVIGFSGAIFLTGHSPCSTSNAVTALAYAT